MSSKSKAYQAAAEHMADGTGLLTPEDLERYHRGSWDIIWKAARRAEWKHSQRDQDVLQASITKLMLEVERLQGERNRQAERYDKLKGEHELTERLYDQIEKENRYNENALKLAEQELTNLRVTVLEERERHTKLGTVLASVRENLATCGAKRNELLVRTVAAEAKLDALEKVPARPQGEGWVLAWTRMTGETITGTVTPERCGDCLNPTPHTGHQHTCKEPPFHQGSHRCVCHWTWNNTGIKRAEPLVRCLAVTGKHACENKTQVGREHPQRHLCHCGTSWSH